MYDRHLIEANLYSHSLTLSVLTNLMSLLRRVQSKPENKA